MTNIRTNLSGLKIGKLTVIQHISKKGWECKCECGKIVYRNKTHLLKNERKACSKSCWGQIKKDNRYYCWINLKRRCLNKNEHNYKYYGERSIKVCQEWIESFETFCKDMGPKTKDTDSIDRIDVNGNYEPTNCRWASPQTQALNRRKKDLNNISVIIGRTGIKTYRVQINRLVKNKTTSILNKTYKTLEEAIINRDNTIKNYDKHIRTS